ncbi:unnamed protein product [Arabis nemorensis]|uniref:Uncharacterized protein n=1 Tax=Arabis nemorensis TaxID=586526 RepID=A0A565CAS3_9BRAS|nr:unnamed protein product [Arabis nemorensis]
MEASAGLVAGSYRRNELVRIRHESDGGDPKLDHGKNSDSDLSLRFISFCQCSWLVSAYQSG